MSPIITNEIREKRVKQYLAMLVAIASKGEVVTYKELAKLVGLHHRDVKYRLDTIKHELIALNELTNMKAPPIQVIVINKNTRWPGDGFDGDPSMEDCNTDDERRERILELQNKVFSYRKWGEVLKYFDIKPIHSFNMGNGRSGGGGEGKEHKKLKEYVSKNPFRVIPRLSKILYGTSEHALPSGDQIDVFVYDSIAHRKIGIEVKSHISNDEDIKRGLYQCVKYQAVLEAMEKVSSKEKQVKMAPNKIEVILVLGRPFPPNLEALRKILGISVRIILPNEMI